MKFFLLLVAVLVLGGTLSFFALRWLGASSSRVAAEQNLTPAEQALRLVQARGCTACHSLDGSKGIGPSWYGSWGSTRQFVDGSSAVVDAAYLQQAMQNPQAQVVAGFDNLMLPAGFTAAEVELVTGLIKGLEQGGLD